MPLMRPPKMSGQPKEDQLSRTPASRGASAAARLRGTLVTLAAAGRYAGGTTAIT